MAEKIDQTILRWVTRFCHWFQRMTGRTNFFLARIAALFTATATAITVLGHYVPILYEKPGVFDVCMCIIITIFALRDAYLCDLSDDDATRGSRTRRRMHLSQSMLVRLFFLFGSLALLPAHALVAMKAPNLILEALHSSFGLSVSIFCYLVEVVPLPPCRGKVREWIGSLFGTPQTAEVRQRTW